MTEIRNEYFPLKNETDEIIGIGIDIHKQLGFGFLEIVYKDAFEYELTKSNILFQREKEYKINYKEIILPHKFYADFIIFDSVILEVKAKEGIADEDMAQTIKLLEMFRLQSWIDLKFRKDEVRH